MHRYRRSTAAAVLTTLAMALSACGSSESDADDAAVSDTSSTSSESDDQGSSEAALVAGTGTLTVDGVEYPGFAGDCSISRGLDPETYEPIPVGDLSTPGLNVVVGVDNVASAPDVEANFIVTSGMTFRMEGLGGPGTIDSIAYVDPATSSDSVDIARVAFSGTTDEGTSVVADIVCEIGLG